MRIFKQLYKGSIKYTKKNFSFFLKQKNLKSRNIAIRIGITKYKEETLLIICNAQIKKIIFKLKSLGSKRLLRIK